MPPYSKIRLKQIEEGELTQLIQEVINSQTPPSITLAINTVDIEQGSIVKSVEFDGVFDEPPLVLGTIENSVDPETVAYQISNVSVSGFNIVFSDNIHTPNYKFNYIASAARGIIPINTQ